MSQQVQWQGWQLDESSAEAYERYLVPLLFAPGAEGLIELAALKPGEQVLDVACGTGIVARVAAARVGSDGKVVGLDVNEGMLEVARSVSRDIHPLIEWRRADVSDMPFADETFDVIFCQQGLQFFKDRPAALSETHRVLAPDGRLVLSVLRSTKHNPGWALLAEVLERYVGPEAGAMMRSPFSSLSTDELRGLFAGAGFRDAHISIGIGPVRYPSAQEFLWLEAVSSPLATPIGALEDNVRIALIRDLKEALVEYTDDDGIIFPAETYLVAASRAVPDDR